MTYLDHDHREGENVRFLARWLPAQDLWRNPSRGAAMPRGALHGIRALSNHCLGKVRDARMTGVVDKDVWLAGCQYGGEAGFRTNTHSLEVPMNHIAGVEVVEPFSYVG